MSATAATAPAPRARSPGDPVGSGDTPSAGPDPSEQWRRHRLPALAMGAWGCGLAVYLAGASPGMIGIASGVVVILGLVAARSRVLARSRQGVDTAVMLAATAGLGCALVALVLVLAPSRADLAMVAAVADGSGASRIDAVILVESVGVTNRGDPLVEGRLMEGRLAVPGGPPSTLNGGGDVVVLLETARGAVPGARIAVEGRVSLSDRPGGALLVIASEPDVVDPPGGLAAVMNVVRHEFVAIAATLPGDGGALLPGLVIGQTESVPPDLTEAMRTTSLSHVLAVSGSNCLILVALVLMVGRALTVPRGVRIGGALALLGAFVVLVTPQPSLVRASTMASLALVAIAMGRPIRGIPTLSLGVGVLLLVDPPLAVDLGFALSVAATAGIVLLSDPIADRLARAMPRGLALAIAIPVAAQLCCQPILLLFAEGIPTAGVLANLVAMPAVAAVTVVGLVSCALAPIAAPVAIAVAWVAWVPASWIGAVARTLANGVLPVLPVAAGVSVAGITAAIVLAIVVVLRTQHARLRSLATVGAAALAVVMTIGWVVPPLLVRAAVPQDWQFAQCDVGQGDALLIRDQGATALVDTGDDPAALRRCLDLLRVARIDLLVLTHFDRDHVGAVPAISGLVDLALVGPTSSVDDEAVVASRTAAGAAVSDTEAGQTGWLGSARWRVLWPPAGDRFAPGNDASVVLSIEGTPPSTPSGRPPLPSAVLLGDLSALPQRVLADAGSLPSSVEIVKVSHHGSADQDPGLYDALRARIALVGVGAGNTYGHPAASTLDLLDTTGSTVVRSDISGTATISARNGGLVLWTERDPAGEPVGTPEPAAASPPVVTGSGDTGGTYHRSKEGPGERSNSINRASACEQDPGAGVARGPPRARGADRRVGAAPG